MAQLLKNTAILGVHLDMLQAHGGKHVKRLWNLVQKGLDSGVVKPLKTTVFERDHVEAAFRYMTKGIHIGKILLKVFLLVHNRHFNRIYDFLYNIFANVSGFRDIKDHKQVTKYRLKKELSKH